MLSRSARRGLILPFSDCVILPGYNVFRRDRDGRGGAVLIAVKSTFHASRLIDLEGVGTELVVVETRNGHDKPLLLEKTLDMIYGDLPRISTLVQRRRVQFAGHCARTSDELVSSFLLWRHPSTLKRSRKLTFPDIISRDTAIAKEDLLTAMTDRIFWKGVLNSISAEAAR